MSSTLLDKHELLASGLFDPDWYRERNADVGILEMDPLDHYLWLGQRFKRSPGPNFDCEKYLSAHGDVVRHNFNPLLHYIRHGRNEGRRIFDVAGPCPVPAHPRSGPRRVAGDLGKRQGRPVVMLCSHVVGKNLFGGERSLLDMIEGLNALDLNVVVTVPGTGNAAYFEKLRANVLAVYILSYGWWRAGVAVDDAVTARFAKIIAKEEVDAVYTNTIVLREPLIAARRMGIRSIVHVRELIRHDEALLDMIGEPAETIIEQVWDSCDRVIVNSEATRSGFARPGREAALVYNTVDFDQLTRLPGPRREGGLRVGLISSNLPKKGTWDFTQVACALAETHPEVSFCLIGPETANTAEIAARIAAGELPSSLKILGYRETPAEAIAETDLVLSLSHFQESFGRTVLEGMAAGRPVIVYDHGAPPEFVAHGETGFIAPLGDTEAVAAAIGRLADDRESLHVMGAKAQAAAIARFNPDAFARQMRTAYDGLWDSRKALTEVLRPRADLDPIPRDQLRIAYFCWHFPVPSETFVLNELRILRAQGVDVRVYCRQSPYPDFSPDFDISWERVHDHHDFAEKLTATGITQVHAHFVYPTVTDMVWPACEAAGIPFSCIAHAQDIFRYTNEMRNRINEFARSPLCRKIFTLSRFHRDYLIDRDVPTDKIAINSNCVDPDLFTRGKMLDRPARRSRRVCAMARFTEKKGLEHLIRAGKLLETDGIEIDIYGYGDLENSYRAIIAEEGIGNVHIHGPVKGRDAVLEMFRGHDLFACPSVRAADGDMDGIPTTLIEAMGAGLPVLATGVAGIPDLVKDNVTGLLTAPTPEAVAARIRAFYALPDIAVEAMIEAAEDRVRSNHNGPDLVEALVRTWANETIDLVMVTWNNLPQTTEIVRRLMANTSLPFHLIICDNGSDAPALAHLLEVHGAHDNVTLILNRENAYVGPGTNIAIAEGTSDYVIYVCGKEGITTRQGWEKPFVSYMNHNPLVGLAGTLCHSPSYLFGRDYPQGIALFDRFRNRDFALQNLNRPFAHVQGGFFVMRRAMLDRIGGFSEDVPHGSTDVEFSYYVESCGWKLGQVPGLMSLFQKTRPGLFHRVDESHGALHPPRLEDLPALDRIACGGMHHCNVCGVSSESFSDLGGAALCPDCGADRRARSIHRLLSESILLYRRLPALGVNVPAALSEFWRFQFQGRVVSAEKIGAELAGQGRTSMRDDRLDIVLLNAALSGDATAMLAEAGRVLAPSGMLLIAGEAVTQDLHARIAALGLGFRGARRFSSVVSHYDWYPIQMFEKVSE